MASLSRRLPVSTRGAYGQNLADCFRLGPAPAFVSRTLRHSQIAVTQIVCDIENNGLTSPIPREDAFLVTLQLRDCPAHDLWIDGKAIKTASLAAGTTCVYDLRQSPMVNSISPFRNLHFYFPRSALEQVTESEHMSLLDSLPHNPGIGMDDSVIRSLGMSLLPAFDRPDEVTKLFVDHITTAAASYVASLFSTAGALPAPGGLAPWQVKRAKEMLCSRLDGVISIAQLASECGLSPSAFSRAFRLTTGKLPHEWLLAERVDRAKHLLRSQLPAAEVAARCGFTGAEHLKRVMDRLKADSRDARRG